MVTMAAHTIETLSLAPNWVSLRVPCQIENVDAVLEMLEPREVQLDSKKHDEMCTAVREVLMNAIEHGGRCDPNLSVELTCIKTHDSVMVLVRDPGRGFSGRQPDARGDRQSPERYQLRARRDSGSPGHAPRRLRYLHGAPNGR